MGLWTKYIKTFIYFLALLDISLGLMDGSLEPFNYPGLTDLLWSFISRIIVFKFV